MFKIEEIYNKAINSVIKESEDDYQLQGKIRWKGLMIDIENKKGSYRTGKDADNKSWRTYMNASYGRIRGTSTNHDNEEVDIYYLSNKDVPFVYQIFQNKKTKSGQFLNELDEYKYIIGAASEKDAKKLYLSQYDSPKFYGGIKSIPVNEFVSHIKDYLRKKDNNV